VLQEENTVIKGIL